MVNKEVPLPQFAVFASGLVGNEMVILVMGYVCAVTCTETNNEKKIRIFFIAVYFITVS
jgi:hypothetical protein